jgi:endonuclease/exonuclease/phosphatase family metal-dependent hydrolase
MSKPELTVLAYNAEDALSYPAKAGVVVNFVDTTRPDIAIFSEAFKAGDAAGITSLNHALNDFEAMGYALGVIDNQEAGSGRPDAHGLLVLANEAMLEPRMQTVVLAGRKALQSSLVLPGSYRNFDFYGYHGNDLDEDSRLADTDSLLLHMGVSMDQPTVTSPTIVGGDLNSMRTRGLQALALRAAGPIMRRLPAEAPHEHGTGIKRKMSLAQRASEMVLGGPLKQLEAAGFTDLDDTNVPTVHENNLALKLDHILATEHFKNRQHTVLPELTIDGDVSGERLSIHRPIIGSVSLI